MMPSKITVPSAARTRTQAGRTATIALPGRIGHDLRAGDGRDRGSWHRLGAARVALGSADGSGPGSVPPARVEGRDRRIARHQHRHVQRLGAIEPVQRSPSGAATPTVATSPATVAVRRAGTCQRVQIGQNVRRVFDRRDLHALHLVQNAPPAVADRADQRDQHRDRSDGARLDPGKNALAGGTNGVLGASRRASPAAVARGMRVSLRRTEAAARHAMRDGKPAFGAEGAKGAVGVHVQIARVGAHITGDEAGVSKASGSAVFDGGDISGLDAQLALNIQQGFAHGGAFTAHQVAKTQIESVEATRLDPLLRLLRENLRPIMQPAPRCSGA